MSTQCYTLLEVMQGKHQPAGLNGYLQFIPDNNKLNICKLAMFTF